MTGSEKKKKNPKNAMTVIKMFYLNNVKTGGIGEINIGNLRSCPTHLPLILHVAPHCQGDESLGGGIVI